jgi:hypothetical protein
MSKPTADSKLELVAQAHADLAALEEQTEQARQRYWLALTEARDAGVTLGTLKAATGQDR